MEMIAARSGGTRHAHGGSCGYAPCWSPACPRPPRIATRAAGRRRAPDGTTPAAKQETAQGALPWIAGVSLAASAWVGSGKQCRDQVWFQVGLGIRDFGMSSCRVMREKNPRALLSRRGRGQETPESGIITRAAVISRGTEVVRVISALVGLDWKFAATRHRIIGHACRQRGRPVPLLPFSGGLQGDTDRPVPARLRGADPRMNHDFRFMSNHFTSRFRSWGWRTPRAVANSSWTNCAGRAFSRLVRKRVVRGRARFESAGLRNAARTLAIDGHAERTSKRKGCQITISVRLAWGGGVHPSPLAINMRPGK